MQNLLQHCWDFCRMGQKTTPKSWPYFCQFLTDFQNSFTWRFCSRFAVNWLLRIPPHLAYGREFDVQFFGPPSVFTQLMEFLCLHWTSLCGSCDAALCYHYCCNLSCICCHHRQLSIDVVFIIVCVISGQYLPAWSVIRTSILITRTPTLRQSWFNVTNRDTLTSLRGCVQSDWVTSLQCGLLLLLLLLCSVHYVPSVRWCCWLGGRKGIRPVKTEWWGASMVICLERGADLHMSQLLPLPLTVSCSSKIQIGFTFLVPAHPGSPGQRAIKLVCVCVCVCVCVLCSV